MKNNRSNKKTHESTIGKIIYGFMLFAPLFAIITNCMYVIFNKNAYQSYAGDYTYKQKTNIEPTEILLNNNYYYGQPQKTVQTVSAGIYKVNNLQQDIHNNLPFEVGYIAFDIWSANAEITFIENNIDITSWSTGIGRININGKEITPYNTVGTIRKTLNNNETSWLSYHLVNSQEINLSFTYIQTNGLGKGTNNENVQSDNIQAQWVMRNVKQDTFIQDNTLSNVFYTSAKHVQESSLFNWTYETLIYKGVESTTLTLGITDTFIPLLLTYWLIISVLYFLYDIILMMLNVLHKKIHEMQDNW